MNPVAPDGVTLNRQNQDNVANCLGQALVVEARMWSATTSRISYLVSDETDYTIPVYGEARGLMNSGIEIRQDLIADQAREQRWADRLARVFGEIEVTLRTQQLLPT